MLRSLVLLAILTLTWGFNWSVLKIGVQALPPLWFRSIGLLLGTALLGLLLIARRTSLAIPLRAVPGIFRLSLPNIIIWYAAVTEAMTMLPAGRAAILGFTMPAWAALIGVLRHGERLDGRTLIGTGAALAGVVLLVAGDWNALALHPLGLGLMLFAAASWAWGTHLFRRVAVELDTLVLTFWMMAVAVPVVFALSAAFEFDRWRVPHDIEWWPILYNAVLVLAVGNVIWFALARRLPPTIAGLSSMAIPAVGVLSGIVLLGETPTWRDWAALVAICVAVGAALIPRPRPAS